MATIKALLIRQHSLSIVAVTGIVFLDFLLSARTRITVEGWLVPIGAVSILSIIILTYSLLRPKPRIVELAAYAAMWITFTTAGCVQTYLTSSMAPSFFDSRFIAWDLAVGFNWVAWVNWIHSSALLTGILRIAYFSLMVQIIASLAIFALARIKVRNEELLVSATLAGIATALLSGLLPAVGPWVHFGTGNVSASDTLYAAHVMAMHLDGARSFKLSELQGIVCFLSYHTVLAVLFIYAHRGIFWTFWPVLVLNSIMFFSLPSEGGHYLADVWGGALLALLAIIATRFLMRVRTQIAPSMIRDAEGAGAAA